MPQDELSKRPIDPMEKTGNEFSPRYLSAKKSIDDRALNHHVQEALRQAMPRAVSGGKPVAVLEIGAGIGNFSGRLMARRTCYVAGEKDPLHLHALRNRFLRTPNVVVQQIDPEHPGDLASMERCFDTVLCLNVLEYLDNPAALLETLRRTLKPNGTIIVLTPQGPGLFGTPDRRLGHKRRYAASEARRLLEAEGFVVETLYQFNKAGTPPWWGRCGSWRAGSRPVTRRWALASTWKTRPTPWRSGCTPGRRGTSARRWAT